MISAVKGTLHCLKGPLSMYFMTGTVKETVNICDLRGRVKLEFRHKI